MKIAHLIPQFYPYVGGAEICSHNVCKTLVENGHEAVIVTTVFEPYPELELPYDIECLWNRTCGLLQKFSFAGKLYLHQQLARLQAKHHFDMWQVTNGYPLGIYAVEFFRRNRIPCLLRCCGEDIQKYPEINYGCRLNHNIDFQVRDKYPLFDGFSALTQTVREEYLALGISEDKIRIIPNGADFARFAKGRENMAKIREIREKYGVGDRKLILTTGRYHPKKGYDLIPEIACALKEKNIDFVWGVAGKNTPTLYEKYPQCSELRIICSGGYIKSDSEDAFSLPPDSLVNLYCAADIFVLPTLMETFGMVLVEAMAAGTPIVTTDAPGVKDVIEDGKSGIQAESGNVDSITRSIVEVLQNQELSSRLIANGLKLAEDFYDWNRVSAEYLDFYKHVAGHQSDVKYVN